MSSYRHKFICIFKKKKINFKTFDSPAKEKIEKIVPRK